MLFAAWKSKVAQQYRFWNGWDLDLADVGVITGLRNLHRLGYTPKEACDFLVRCDDLSGQMKEKLAAAKSAGSATLLDPIWEFYGEEGCSYLHTAVTTCDLTLVKETVKKGYDVNARNAAGSTPLHFAARGHSILNDKYQAIVEYLIAAGADTTLANEAGKTPYQEAVDSGNLKIAEILAER